MNVTDIDDKIILRSNEMKEDFTQFARKWENEFFADMKALGVKMPDAITRVSEFIPEIIAYIEKIIKNGYAYASNGSVYFDIEAFRKSGKHTYAKLEPGSMLDPSKYKEGEGSLGVELKSEKHNSFDFALWKKSKEGEPKWPSPWGEGRPGWHIECSAMASEMFKVYPIDMHSGGVDLRFPHHDNEMAQSEAYYECPNWVNCFMHSGHLEIRGQKMSKSLKNFVTIKQALQDFSGRQIRIMTLLHNWDVTFNYTEKAMPEAVEKERQIEEFFLSAKAVLRNSTLNKPQKWLPDDYKLNELLCNIQDKIHKALCDSFDTPSALGFMFELISATNGYLKNEQTAKLTLLLKVLNYIQLILQSFGLSADGQFGLAAQKDTKVDEEAAITPVMNALASFRDEIKAKAKSGPEEIFKACDRLRSEVLPPLGIRLEDKGKDQPAVWKKVDPEKLKEEKKQKAGKKKEAKVITEEEKAKKEEEKKKALEIKQQKEANKQKKQADKLKKKMTPATELFKLMTDKYSKFDEKGLPTHDATGKELSPEQIEALKKEYEKQESSHKKWLEEEQNKKKKE
jgi:cysteinyl-tRNA synthetase